MRKMGYTVGQGLGEDSQGITEPIKIQGNSSRQVLGFLSGPLRNILLFHP